ncbi:hypothetical protein LSTR_LSTR009463 [Laodelphax striatellus]|uniref:Uncharacterized protein n=1 Tax=Laodelphax striatellus TaxID=195883 RepID=A0A482WFJ7_LAOST|nr:hypothetical protein LSTR_LSTR009463 [Laodelphax striatellus]
MAFYYPVLALILSTGTSVFSKSLAMEPFHHIQDFSEIERQKRQSHPAATVARYQERPSSILQREGFRDDELVDYLTPPRPPDPLDTFGKTGFSSGPSTPSPPVLPGTVLQQSADGKWNLGYNADEVLIPPIDPYLFGPETKYNTIQQNTKTIQGGLFGSSTKNSNNSPTKSSLFDNFNFDKDPFFNADTQSSNKPNNFQDPLNNNNDDTKFKPFIPSPSFPATDALTNGHSGNPNGHLQTNNQNQNQNPTEPSLNFLANSALGFITATQPNGLRSQNFNFDTISHSFPNTNPPQNNFNLQNHNLNTQSQGFVPLITNNNNNINDPANQNFRTGNSNFNNFPNTFQGSQNPNTDLFANNFRGAQTTKVDVSVPFVKRQTDHNKRQIDSEEENESGEEDDAEDDHHHKPSGPVYTFVKTDKHGHFKWGVRHMV